MCSIPVWTQEAESSRFSFKLQQSGDSQGRLLKHRAGTLEAGLLAGMQPLHRYQSLSVQIQVTRRRVLIGSDPLGGATLPYKSRQPYRRLSNPEFHFCP